jgi:tripartite-type tricarboxylate transporter receptor subunit TctC
MLLRVIFIALGFAIGSVCVAQQYPAKPIRVISPWTPGGGADIVARLVAAKLTESWGQQVVVENRAGATGTIGTDVVAKSAPNGYTLLVGTNATHVLAVSLLPSLPYDQEKDLAPITRIAAVPHVIAVHLSLPVKTVAELVALTKSKPNVSFGSAGNGSTPHLAGELFKQVTGAKLLHVPYKGTSQSLQDTLGGYVQVSFDTMPSVLGYIQSGRLRAIAIAGPKRVDALPGIPTVAEGGAPGAEQFTWYGMFGPGGLPADIVRKLHAEVGKIVQLPDIKARLDSLGNAEPASASPEEFAAMVKAEIVKYAKVIRDANLHLD